MTYSRFPSVYVANSWLDFLATLRKNLAAFRTIGISKISTFSVDLTELAQLGKERKLQRLRNIFGYYEGLLWILWSVCNTFFLRGKAMATTSFFCSFQSCILYPSFFVAGENGGVGRREERVGHAPRPRCPPARPPVGGLRQPRPFQGGLAGVLARGHWPRLSRNRQVKKQKIGPNNFSWWTKKIIEKELCSHFQFLWSNLQKISLLGKILLTPPKI